MDKVWIILGVVSAVFFGTIIYGLFCAISFFLGAY